MSEFAPICIYLVISLLVALVSLLVILFQSLSKRQNLYNNRFFFGFLRFLFFFYGVFDFYQTFQSGNLSLIPRPLQTLWLGRIGLVPPWSGPSFLLCNELSHDGSIGSFRPSRVGESPRANLWAGLFRGVVSTNRRNPPPLPTTLFIMIL